MRKHFLLLTLLACISRCFAIPDSTEIRYHKTEETLSRIKDILLKKRKGMLFALWGWGCQFSLRA